MGELRMPSLGADMEAGTLVEWKIKPGDAVKRGQVVGVIETAKGAIDLEVWETGTVEQLLLEPGNKVPVGTVIARIGGAEAKPAAAAAPAPPPTAPAAPAASPAAPARPEVAGARGPRASPLARKVAKELGVDLSQVTGTGPAGAIRREDVEAFAAKRAAAPAAERTLAMRRAIAAAVSHSKREIPHYYLATHIDMSRALDWLREKNEGRPVADRLLPVVLLIKAVGLAARAIPEVNGFWVQDRFRQAESVHVGFAISLRQGGLVVPALHDVDNKDLDLLMRELNDLVARARTGHLRSSEMADATITVTSLGDRGAESVLGVIFPPQVALVGFGKIVEAPAAFEGRIELRPRIEASLSGDHRASDGHRGGLFLERLERLLQAPEKL